MSDQVAPRKFIVRQSRDYSIEVEANSEEEAIQIARDTPIESMDWNSDWSGLEAEEVISDGPLD